MPRRSRPSVEKIVQTFVIERHAQNGPARRALEAELSGRWNCCWTRSGRPGESAADASSARRSTISRSVAGVLAAELRATFEVADRIWMSLDVALDTAPLPP